MARYTGPKWKIARRENFSVFGDDDWKNRSTLPGQHGGSSRRKSTAYAMQFREKQKIKRTYGMQEKQFVRFLTIAQKSKENTAVTLLQLLEMRLDNVVFRAGLAKTRNQARQFVTHGHILVNGKRMDIPSAILNVGDEVSVIAKLEAKPAYKAYKVKPEIPVKWLNILASGCKVVAKPSRDMMDKEFNEQAVIEFYSR
jgi:small subunit ribosomal protein S4